MPITFRKCFCCIMLIKEEECVMLKIFHDTTTHKLNHFIAFAWKAMQILSWASSLIQQEFASCIHRKFIDLSSSWENKYKVTKQTCYVSSFHSTLSHQRRVWLIASFRNETRKVFSSSHCNIRRRNFSWAQYVQETFERRENWISIRLKLLSELGTS